MPLYVVRVKDTQELAALLYVPSLEALYFHLDERFDPNRCEYRRLPHGGLLFPNQAPVVPQVFAYDEEYDEFDFDSKVDKWKDSVETDSWYDQIDQTAHAKPHHWKPVPSIYKNEAA